MFAANSPFSLDVEGPGYGWNCDMTTKNVERKNDRRPFIIVTETQCSWLKRCINGVEGGASENIG